MGEREERERGEKEKKDFPKERRADPAEPHGGS